MVSWWGGASGGGTIDLSLKVSSLITKEDVVLDYGAGRAACYEDDTSPIRRKTRLFKGWSRKVIAADIDQAVLSNMACDEAVLQVGEKLPILDSSVDLIIADYVLEHVVEPSEFARELKRVLKPGGWFCARTPYKYSYVALLAQLAANKSHSSLLRYIQPNRKEVDVFPTAYKMNRIADVRYQFEGWEDHSFMRRQTPSYFFGNRFLYECFGWLHRAMPMSFSGSLSVFLRKPLDPAMTKKSVL